jgi:hypothetical protein
MTDHVEQNSPRGRPISNDEPVTSTSTTESNPNEPVISTESKINEPVTSTKSNNNETIASLIGAVPIIDSNTVDKPRDDSPSRPLSRSSISVIQALVNTSHLLTTHDARKR